jgi:hypothetical protein
MAMPAPASRRSDPSTMRSTAGMRAERQSGADLALALIHHVCQDTVDTGATQGQAEDPE